MTDPPPPARTPPAAPERDRAALLVVDMQNGFCHPMGTFARLGVDASRFAAAVPGCRRLVAAARDAAVPVFYTVMEFGPDRDGGRIFRELLPRVRAAGGFAAGGWDAAIVDELTPAPGDEIVSKDRFSAFLGTDLDVRLRERDVDEVVIAGVTTNMCVESTARDAAQRDYRTFVVGDATGERDAAQHEHALRTLGYGFAHVVSVAAVERFWAERRDTLAGTPHDC